MFECGLFQIDYYRGGEVPLFISTVVTKAARAINVGFLGVNLTSQGRFAYNKAELYAGTWDGTFRRIYLLLGNRISLILAVLNSTLWL